MTPATLAVVNPASAGGRTARSWPSMRRILRDSGVDCEEHQTACPGDATRVVRQALLAGCGRVVAVGGDGTLNEVVNGFFDEDGKRIGEVAVLGILPSGTGGDFRRSLGVPRRTEAAVWVIAAGHTRPVDAGRIDYAGGAMRYFVNIADCGLGGAVVSQVNASRRKHGGAAGSAIFLWHSLAGLLRYPGFTCTVRVDGESVSLHAQSVVVANGQYFGGGMRIAPEARLDDGLFDVVVVDRLGASASVRALPALYRGRHLGRRGVRLLRGAVVEVLTDDSQVLFDVEGEQAGEAPARLTCLRHALRCCAPPPGR